MIAKFCSFTAFEKEVRINVRIGQMMMHSNEKFFQHEIDLNKWWAQNKDWNISNRKLPGLMRTAAYENAEFLRPDLWHSMTVDVRMGTTWDGNFEMFLATLQNKLEIFVLNF